jgi:hypothetical protein
VLYTYLIESDPKWFKTQWSFNVLNIKLGIAILCLSMVFYYRLALYYTVQDNINIVFWDVKQCGLVNLHQYF